MWGNTPSNNKILQSWETFSDSPFMASIHTHTHEASRVSELAQYTLHPTNSITIELHGNNQLVWLIISITCIDRAVLKFFDEQHIICSIRRVQCAITHSTGTWTEPLVWPSYIAQSHWPDSHMGERVWKLWPEICDGCFYLLWYILIY